MSAIHVQEACETLEGLLERDIEKKVLTHDEFHALNRLLLEASVWLGYKVKEEEQ
ncbi:hypothetical protein [Salimicrobium album]|uniref:Phage protein n=1 Tax=Salimicrobium album TaxID=50717 RepID=A0A1H3DEP5_9BACI|nr:hypothetical protein [Salimicrobium album]SDX64866.1 hypothetical protein SAMN04488081_0937 [Salimicrobium album]